MKKISMFLIVCFVVVSTGAFAQIKVLSTGYVNLGIANTNTANAVDILGTTAIRPTSSGVYLRIGNDPSYGFYLNPSSAHNGQIGYQTSFRSVNSDYVYSNGVLLTSDSKFKTNIKQLDVAMPLIKKLRPVTFDYNFDYSKVENDILKTKLQGEDKNRLGFIAQEVKEVLPQAIQERESDSTLCIRMDDFIPLLVKGLQEQSLKIDSLKSLIEDMKTSQNLLKSATISTGSVTNLSENRASLEQNIPNPFSKETRI